MFEPGSQTRNFTLGLISETLGMTLGTETVADSGMVNEAGGADICTDRA